MLTRLSSVPLRKFSFLAVSYAQLGHDAEADAAAAEFRKLMEPDSVSLLGDDGGKWRDHWLKMFSILIPEDFEHLLDGLCKAGLPA